MANDGKIYITISDRRFGKNKAESDEQNTADKEKEQKNPLADFAAHRFFNFIESQTKQAINYTIGNIGNFTGDYAKQQHVADALQGVTFLVNMATSAYAGFKLSGGSPWGAAIAVGIQTTASVINEVQQLVAGYTENARQNRNIAQLRTRSGLNSANNGSRGTEY